MIVLKNALVFLATLVFSLNDVIVRADDEDGDNELVNLVENMNDFFMTESAITNNEEFQTDNSKTIREYQKSQTIQNAGAKQAFVICNHEFGADGSTRSQQIREATGNGELELGPIYNQDDKSCYLSSITSAELTPMLKMKYISSIFLSKKMKIKAGTLYGISTRMAQADENRPMSFHMKMNVDGNVVNIEKVLSKAVAHAKEAAQEGCETFYDKNGANYDFFSYEASTDKEFVLTWSLPMLEHALCLKQLIVYATESNQIEFIEMKPSYVTSNFAAGYILQGGSLSDRDTPFWDNGIEGQNQIVQVSDTGLDTTHCFFKQDGDVTKNQSGAWQPDKRKVVQYFTFVDKTDYNQGHGTHVAGTVNGYASSSTQNKGVAYESKLALFDIGDGQGYLQLPTSKSGWYAMMEVAHKITSKKLTNASIHSASWGANTAEYNSDSAWFDGYTFENPNFLTFIAAGNSGPSSSSIGAPATAKNIISVGATNRGSNADTLISWSSRGPTSDGRIGPMVVAPGVGTVSASAKNKNNGNCDTVAFSGTSMATPATAGAAALVRQYFKEGWYEDGTKGSGEPYEATAALLKAVILNGAQKISNFKLYDSNQGYGRVSLYHSLPLQNNGGNDKIKFMKKEESIENKKSKVYEITMSNTAPCADLRMTLVWTDEAAQSGCNKCLVNDLDLTAQVNGGNALYPNGKTGKDKKNNAERIIITDLEANDKVKMTVFGANLNREKMDFALVAVGCFGDVQTGPTPAPKPDTPQPSKKPVVSPAPTTAAPTPQNEAPSPGCIDDADLKFFVKGVKRDCAWIYTKKEKFKKKVCKKPKVQAGCLQACDLCEEFTDAPVSSPSGGPGPEPGPCKDNPNFKQSGLTCKQIKNKSKNKGIEYLFGICWEYNNNIGWVYGSCKETCKFCSKKGSDCCAASYDGRVGCDKKSCQRTVSKIDDYCINTTWDLFCAVLAEDVCDLCSS